MRKMIFRAWDKENKKMLKADKFDLHYSGDVFLNEYGDLHIPLTTPSQYILMQYTGRRDKNGAGIFEGDIVRAFVDMKDKHRYEISQVHWDNSKLGFAFSYRFLFNHAIISEEIGYDIEVIGNIYENPELLPFRSKINDKLQQIFCRECGDTMEQYPYNILAWCCKKCKLKAELTYKEMPVVKLK
jgi:uncharacterized phage protein (TIGR01671 family)